MSSNSTVVGVIADSGNRTDVTYLPNCTSAVSYASYSVSAATEFNPDTSQYYKDQLRFGTAGWVFAGLGLVCAIMFTISVLARYLGSCKGARQRRHMCYILPYTNDVPIKYGVFGRRCTVVLCTAIGITLLLVVATAAWGLAEGLLAVRNVSTGFWAIIDDARGKVQQIENSISGLLSGVDQLQTALTGVTGALPSLGGAGGGSGGGILGGLLQSLPAPLNLTGLGTSDVSSGLGILASGLSGLANSSSSGGSSSSSSNITSNIQQSGVHALDKLKADNKPLLDNIQDVYVPAALGVLFAVLLLLAVLATGLLLARQLGCGSLFLMLLLYWAALVNFVGPGLLHFGGKLADDACLYSENFSFRYVEARTSLSPSEKAAITAGLSYYYGGLTDNNTLDQVINQVYNLELSAASALVNNTAVSDTLDALSSIASQALLTTAIGLNSSELAAIGRVPTAFNNVLQNLTSLQLEIDRQNFAGLYGDIKGLLCCTLANRVRLAWIAWIVAATFTGVLCFLLTLRVYQVDRGFASATCNGAIFTGATSVKIHDGSYTSANHGSSSAANGLRDPVMNGKSSEIQLRSIQ